MPVLNRFDNICLRLVTHCIIDLRVVSYLLSVANLGCARLLTLGEQLGYESLPTPCGRRARDRPSDQAGDARLGEVQLFECGASGLRRRRKFSSAPNGRLKCPRGRKGSWGAIHPSVYAKGALGLRPRPPSQMFTFAEGRGLRSRGSSSDRAIGLQINRSCPRGLLV